MILQENDKPMMDEKSSGFGMETDKSRIFWIVVLGILGLSFIFVFGYWIGHNNQKNLSQLEKEVNPAKNLVVEGENLKDILGEEKITIKQQQEDKLSLKGKENKETSTIQENKSDLKTSLGDLGIEKKEITVNLENNNKKETKNKKTTVSQKNPKNKNQTTVSKNTKKYIIQIASFKQKEKAMKLKEKLNEQGYKGYIIQQGNIFKVRIGNFEDYNQATSTLSKVMASLKIKDAFIFTSKKA